VQVFLASLSDINNVIDQIYVLDAYQLQAMMAIFDQIRKHKFHP